MSGVSSVIQGLSDRYYESIRRILNYKIQFITETRKSCFHTAVGDICWITHRETEEGISAAVMDLANHFKQRSKLVIQQDADILVMDRSFQSLHKVFQSTPNLLTMRGVMDTYTLRDLYKAMQDHFAPPALIIYVETTTQELETRLKKANRHCIEPYTLTCLDNLYNEYLQATAESNPNVAILRLPNIGTLDAIIHRAHVGMQELYYLQKLSKYLKYLKPHIIFPPT